MNGNGGSLSAVGGLDTYVAEQSKLVISSKQLEERDVGLWHGLCCECELPWAPPDL